MLLCICYGVQKNKCLKGCVFVKQFNESRISLIQSRWISGIRYPVSGVQSNIYPAKLVLGTPQIYVQYSTVHSRLKVIGRILKKGRQRSLLLVGVTDDHPVYTSPNHHPPKMDVLSKNVFKSSLPLNLLCSIQVQYTMSTSPNQRRP